MDIAHNKHLTSRAVNVFQKTFTVYTHCTMYRYAPEQFCTKILFLYV